VYPGDSKLCYLIHYVVQLSELVLNNKKLIQEYYLEFLHTLDTEKLGPELQKFLSHAKNLSSAVTNYLETIKTDVREAKIDTPLEGIRLNWYRVSAALSNTQSGVPALLTGPLSAMMTQLVHHTRNVDCVPTQLKTHGSFQDAFWYRQELGNNLKSDLKNNQGQTECAMSYVKVLNHALYNVHRICPEEQVPIGKEICQLADAFLRNIAVGAQTYLNVIVTKGKQLRSQTRPNKVAARMQLGMNPQAPKQPQPGVESLMVNRRHRDVINMLESRKGLSDLCNSMLHADTITIYNIEFVPREYLIEVVQYNIR